MQTVVKRTVGFVRDFPYVAETTTETQAGAVTVREFGYTPGGAAQRAELAARDRAPFAGMRRVAGFVKHAAFHTPNRAADYAVGFIRNPAFGTPNNPAPFRVGFA